MFHCRDHFQRYRIHVAPHSSAVHLSSPPSESQDHMDQRAQLFKLVYSAVIGMASVAR